MEEARSRKLGGSLKVPNVQQLAKQQLAAVPPRYIRNDIENQSHSSIVILPQVPVIDMKKLLEIGDDDDTELNRFHLACQEWGFFQLVNHGVSSSLMEKVKSETRAFFDLPMEEKKKFEQEEGDLEGYGQAFVVSEEQKLDWADILYMITLPTHLRKPHLFPKLPPSLRDALEQYTIALKELAMKILYTMARTLGMKAEDMNVLFEEDATQMMRINYYPPCPQPELVMGLCPHTDSIGLTILLQVNETEGLQIKKDGAWIPVPYRPDAFVINIGDILEIVTNGIYKSIEYRAIVNEDKERISIATFLSPKLDKTIEEYAEEIKELSMKVLKMLGKALGIDEEEVKSLFEEGMQSMRMNYYPTCPQPDNVMGICPHSDASALTILLQVNETQGLQIKKDGIWIPVLPLPNAFVVNVGDAFEIFSNGIYRSVEHRSVVNSEKERISVATFHSPRLDSACREWGFFQVINHGVSGTLVEKVKKDTQDFFNLPPKEKEMLKQVDGDMDGYGQAFVVSEEQKLDWADMFFLTTLPTYFRKQHIFSHLPQPFRRTVELYAAELKKLALKMIDFVAKALNMDEEYIRELFGEGMQSMRMNYYPACPQPEKVIGLTPHSDAVGLTILLQLNQMEGLQIKKDGLWIPISPLPNAFIINIGDILEIVTNGAYRSIEHRAMVNSEKERLSIATFYNTKLDGQICPAPSIISAKNPAKFRSIGAADYFRGLFSRKLDKKSYLDVMRIENFENPAS
ncbi:uncharacterized protein LOC129872804 [Solanum dulcamara]|uniref:uncharacterized protein LOC129872804 n=1 Tax=Solanum dulcamara TaxID=45834 RepID=UPI002484E2C4|nr:uncharacterized protein LOC129872804 [Solanum dulcamara]